MLSNTLNTTCLDEEFENTLMSIHDPIGLKNYGNTCYINSIIQCLRVIASHVNGVNDFVSHSNSQLIELAKIDKQFLNEDNFVIAYYNVLNNSNDSNLKQFINQLFKLNLEFKPGLQMDSHELLLTIFNVFSQFGRLLEQSINDNPIGEFNINLLETIKCKDNFCNHEKIIQENFLAISVQKHSKEGDLLQSILSQILAPVNMCGANAYFCSNQQKYCTAVKSQQINRYPNVLIINLLRFNHGTKIKDALNMSETLNLNGNIYELIGITLHAGQQEIEGHYTSKN